jgi:hypothetical protein
MACPAASAASRQLAGVVQLRAADSSPAGPRSSISPPCSPVYDTLLDDYEKGMTSARLDEIFGQVLAEERHQRCQQCTIEWRQHTHKLRAPALLRCLCHLHPLSSTCGPELYAFR